MSVNETLRKSLDRKSKRSVAEDYSAKLQRLDLPDETSLLDANFILYERKLLESWGLTKGQRSGVSNILGHASHVYSRNEAGKVLEEHETTIGDLRKLSDSDLHKLTSPKGAKVLRALFGKKEETEI